VECAKPQAATKFLSHAGENVSRKSRKPAQLKAFSFKDYRLVTKLISIMDNIFVYTAFCIYYLTPFFCFDYPILSQMTKIYLADSPGSVPPVESMFSTAGYMLNQKDHQWHHIKWTWCCSFMTTMMWCAEHRAS